MPTVRFLAEPFKHSGVCAVCDAYVPTRKAMILHLKMHGFKIFDCEVRLHVISSLYRPSSWQKNMIESAVLVHVLILFKKQHYAKYFYVSYALCVLICVCMLHVLMRATITIGSMDLHTFLCSVKVM